MQGSLIFLTNKDSLCAKIFVFYVLHTYFFMHLAEWFCCLHSSSIVSILFSWTKSYEWGKTSCVIHVCKEFLPAEWQKDQLYTVDSIQKLLKPKIELPLHWFKIKWKNTSGQTLNCRYMFNISDCFLRLLWKMYTFPMMVAFFSLHTFLVLKLFMWLCINCHTIKDLQLSFIKKNFSYNKDGGLQLPHIHVSCDFGNIAHWIPQKV